MTQVQVRFSTLYLLHIHAVKLQPTQFLSNKTGSVKPQLENGVIIFPMPCSRGLWIEEASGL